MSKKSTPKRTQAERTRHRKAQIIREAIRFFGQDGYHGTRLADIAKAAGITEPGLLYHFPSKAHLLMEVLAERDRIDRARLDSAQQEGMKGPLALVEDLVEYNETVPGLVQLFTVLVAESIDAAHPGHEFFKQRYQHLREQTVTVLKEAQSRGDIRRDIPAEDMVILLFAMMDGLQVQWLYEPDRIEMARLFRLFLSFLKEA